MRIVTVDPEKCRPDKCGHECYKYCPVVKSGKPEIISIGEKSLIDEELCIGCGICTKLCPFKAITVVNLPEETGSPVHRYGHNLFALFGIPTPGESVGVLGPNGTGKTTILNIFAGQLVPNLGEGEGSWPRVIEHFSGTEVGGFLRGVSEGKIRVSYKPQNITFLPKAFKGDVASLLHRTDERGKLNSITGALNMQGFMKKKLSQLSGGELQKVAIAATLAKEADIYFFDEPGSFLDIYERLRVSRVIKQFAPRVFVVEHDLVMLDYLTDNIHVTYGKSGSYGVVSLRKGVRVGINEFLDGYLKAENMRVRSEPLKFTQSSSSTGSGELVSFSDISVSLGDFRLSVGEGRIKKEEIVGIIGRNALGKTTFIRVLAGELKARGTISRELKVSYKPQYIGAPARTVDNLFAQVSTPADMNLNRDIFAPLDLVHLQDRKASQLSGGELQRVAIGLCLAEDADIYLLDEPSAFLDSEQRLRVARLLRRIMQNRGKSAVVVEHDLMFLDYLSDRVIVFLGEPGAEGKTTGPVETAEGMNLFLRSVDITLRRDQESKRPRVNKPDSQKDREQRAKKQYYEPI